mmetsp:Transcript_2443/g.5247  ORF Transcript_2443/g.5247 Transcript_2443/m.5247 type:complete len:323 (-) Transcript_2443:785-1753(-)
MVLGRTTVVLGSNGKVVIAAPRRRGGGAIFFFLVFISRVRVGNATACRTRSAVGLVPGITCVRPIFSADAVIRIPSLLDRGIPSSRRPGQSPSHPRNHLPPDDWDQVLGVYDVPHPREGPHRETAGIPPPFHLGRVAGQRRSSVRSLLLPVVSPPSALVVLLLLLLLLPTEPPVVVKVPDAQTRLLVPLSRRCPPKPHGRADAIGPSHPQAVSTFQKERRVDLPYGAPGLGGREVIPQRRLVIPGHVLLVRGPGPSSNRCPRVRDVPVVIERQLTVGADGLDRLTRTVRVRDADAAGQHHPEPVLRLDVSLVRGLDEFAEGE